MHINCEKLVETFLLNKNPLYTFSLPISLIISIIVFGIAVNNNWSINSYILQILIPIVSLLLSMVCIDMISRMMISESEKNRLIKLCKLWMHNPNVRNNPVLNNIQETDLNLISIYNGKIEGFENRTNSQVEPTLSVNPLSKKDKSLKESNELKDNSMNNVVFENNRHVEEIDHISANNELSSLLPAELNYNNNESSMCIEDSNSCNLCSGSNSNPNNIIAPIPGPQWLPQTADTVQRRLNNNEYTKNRC
jgi:phosphate/sulfate permease